MRVEARLHVIDGRVLCPRTCRWEAVDHCQMCSELARIEWRESPQGVVCRPDVTPLTTTVERLLHA